MLRLTKLTDYGIVLLTHFAQHSERDAQNARELALETRLPLPTVGKLLKELTHAGLLVSHRGKDGGYALARGPERISVAEIIAALEGPIAITECNNVTDPGLCEHETGCPVRANWQVVNRAIREALEKISLAEMAHPLPSLFGLTHPGTFGKPLSAAPRGN
jgi:FeS assembly SUF system regulator